MEQAARVLLTLGQPVGVLVRGVVGAITPDAVLVTVAGGQAQLCDVLLAGPEPPCLVEGETVLVWCASAPEERGVILGSVRPSASTARPDRGPGDEMVLEAKRRLTLKCGDGSITIREDGKILIKGKDLVSHATRMNRIKGGSVQIN